MSVLLFLLLFGYILNRNDDFQIDLDFCNMIAKTACTDLDIYN